MAPRRALRFSPKAFTLIEVLVVVAIIALLVAVLLPSLKRARELSQATVCGTRLSQVFRGALMYSQANKDRLPYFGWRAGRQANEEWWPTQIARQVGNAYEVYLCPTDDQPFQIDVVYENGTIRMPRTSETKTPVPLKLSWRSACDTLMGSGPNGAPPYIARKLTSWSRPGKAILVVESECKITGTTGSGNLECFRFGDSLSRLMDPDTLKKQPKLLETWQRHVGKTNLLFMDGHIDRLLPAQVARLAEHQEHYLSSSGS